MSEVPLYSPIQVSVFTLDRTKKQWIATSNKPVTLSFMRNESNSSIRIVAMDDTKALVNSTLGIGVKFKATSTIFGQWQDKFTSSLYGLKFGSEDDLKNFSTWFAESVSMCNSEEGEQKLTYKEVLILQDYQAQDKGQLTLVKGEKVFNVTKTVEEGWYEGIVVNNKTKVKEKGIFPSLYIHLPSASPGSTGAASTGTSSMPGTPKSSKPEFRKHQRSSSSSAASSISVSKKRTSAIEIDPNESIEIRALKQELNGLRDENEKLKTGIINGNKNIEQWQRELEKSREEKEILFSKLVESVAILDVWKTTLAKCKDNRKGNSRRLKELEGNVDKMTVILKGE